MCPPPGRAKVAQTPGRARVNAYLSRVVTNRVTRHRLEAKYQTEFYLGVYYVADENHPIVRHCYDRNLSEILLFEFASPPL